MRAAFPRDLRPALPQTRPDLRIAIRREDELAAIGHRIVPAVPLLFGGSIVVVSACRTCRCKHGKAQCDCEHHGFHVSIPDSSAAAARSNGRLHPAGKIADNIDKAVATIAVSTKKLHAAQSYAALRLPAYAVAQMPARIAATPVTSPANTD